MFVYLGIAPMKLLRGIGGSLVVVLVGWAFILAFPFLLLYMAASWLFVGRREERERKQQELEKFGREWEEGLRIERQFDDFAPVHAGPMSTACGRALSELRNDITDSNRERVERVVVEAISELVKSGKVNANVYYWAGIDQLQRHAVNRARLLL
jgi:hypothetical protein